MVKIKETSITFCLGDTSFRRSSLIDDYKTLLESLFTLYYQMDEEKDISWSWKQNEPLHHTFYRHAEETTSLFNNKEIEDDEASKRGRTYTNGLVKMGFCDADRVVTDVGKAFLGIKKIQKDDFEKRIAVKTDNIIFIRQLLKMKIYKISDEKAYNPFRLLLKLLSEFDDEITLNECMFILHLSNSKTDYELLVEQFKKYKEGESDLSEVIDYSTPTFDSLTAEQQYYIDTGLDLDEAMNNQKSGSTKSIYVKFVETVQEFNKETNKANFKKLIPYFADDKIKKAFNFKNLYNIREVRKLEKIDEIESFTSKIPFLGVKEETEFRKLLISEFRLGKKSDLFIEYSDITKRVFKATGIISFEHNKAAISNIYVKEYIKEIANEFEFVLDKSEENYNENISILDILDNNIVGVVDTKLSEEYNIEPGVDITSFIKKQNEEKFAEFVKENFAKEKIVYLLENISKRNDEEVMKGVTSETTVSTIFEYILGIAWYYISEEKIPLYSSLNLTMDSSFLPITHASGGHGDLEICYKEAEKHWLMLEATLMDINNQKRGELEPVIRHATNYTVEHDKEFVYTLFVANELDNNVKNLFRFCDLVNLESSYDKGHFTGSTKILSLTIENIINMLKKEIYYEEFFTNVQNEFIDTTVEHINNNWHTKFIQKIFSA